MNKFIYILLIIFLVSCKKGDMPKQQEVRGILLHRVTMLPLPNQKVDLCITEREATDLRDPEISGTVYHSYCSIISTVTGSSGEFKFTFTPNTEWSYQLLINTAQHTYAGTSLQLAWNGVKFRSAYLAQSITDTLYAEKPGYIKFRIENIPPVYTNDTFYFSDLTRKFSSYEPFYLITGNKPDCIARTYFQSPIYYYGGTFNREVIDTVPAESNSKYYFHWLYKRNGTSILTQDSVIVTPFNMTNYNIHY